MLKGQKTYFLTFSCLKGDRKMKDFMIYKDFGDFGRGRIFLISVSFRDVRGREMSWIFLSVIVLVGAWLNQGY